MKMSAEHIKNILSHIKNQPKKVNYEPKYEKCDCCKINRLVHDTLIFQPKDLIDEAIAEGTMCKKCLGQI